MNGFKGGGDSGKEIDQRVCSTILLSICIPTFNRASFIGATLDSIASQIVEEVEVVIVDGASTDSTSDVVSSLRSKLPNLIYYRGNTNMGVDRDMATAVELARGEYCWLMSSDDLLAPGAIPILLKEIKTKRDIYLCEATLCDKDMKPIRDTVSLSKRLGISRFNLADRDQLLMYLSLANSNSALFCYMSVLIFRRRRWLEVQFNAVFDRTGYAHVFTLLSLYRAPCFVQHISQSLVVNRPGNDSFSRQGLEKRYLLDFDGYLLLAEHLFADDPQVRTSFLRVMTREHPWYRIIKLRAEVKSLENWEDLREKLIRFGYSPAQIAFCGALGRARLLVRAAVYVNSKFPRSKMLRYLRRGSEFRSAN